jgi:hypothetical protein
MQAALQATEAYLVELLAGLSDGQRADISAAMAVLRPAFLLDIKSAAVAADQERLRSRG